MKTEKIKHTPTLFICVGINYTRRGRKDPDMEVSQNVAVIRNKPGIRSNASLE